MRGLNLWNYPFATQMSYKTHVNKKQHTQATLQSQMSSHKRHEKLQNAKKWKS